MQTNYTNDFDMALALKGAILKRIPELREIINDVGPVRIDSALDLIYKASIASTPGEFYEVLKN